MIIMMVGAKHFSDSPISILCTSLTLHLKIYSFVEVCALMSALELFTVLVIVIASSPFCDR